MQDWLVPGRADHGGSSRRRPRASGSTTRSVTAACGWASTRRSRRTIRKAPHDQDELYIVIAGSGRS